MSNSFKITALLLSLMFFASCLLPAFSTVAKSSISKTFSSQNSSEESEDEHEHNKLLALNNDSDLTILALKTLVFLSVISFLFSFAPFEPFSPPEVRL